MKHRQKSICVIEHDAAASRAKWAGTHSSEGEEQLSDMRKDGPEEEPHVSTLGPQGSGASHCC